MSQVIPVVPVATATGKVKEMFDAVNRHLKMVPNLMATMANSPAALSAYLQFSGALSGDSLTKKQHELLALSVGQANHCGYCVSAHTVLGSMAGVDATGAKSARHFQATDAKDAAVLAFAKAVYDHKGQTPATAVTAARAAGLSDANLIDIVGHVALNIFTNYFNETFKTEIDFPVVDLAAA